MPTTATTRPTATPTPARLALSIEAAAEALGISRAYAYQLVDAGALRTFTLGRRRLVSVAALNAFIAKRERAGGAITDAARAAGRRARACRGAA